MTKRFTCVALLVALALTSSARAESLSDYAKNHTIELFIPRRGAVMPNPYDSPGHLQLGTKALLLSGLNLTDLDGISQLTVLDEGKPVPVTSVEHLHVYINHNPLKSLPDEIGKLDNVEFLYCEFDQLDDLPRGLADMDRLIAMYFTGNRFKEIPAFVFDMSRLTKLQFSKNQITVVPREIGDMTELRHLSLAGNQIAKLPDSIARLVKLRVCDLSDNQLTELPEVFGKVRIVNQLRVRNNPLRSLPAGFAEMRATIDITGTDIDLATLSPELREHISTEKPPGSKDPNSIVVTRPE